MDASIQEIESALTALGRPSPWGPDLKVSDDFLDPLFKKFFERLKLPNLMRKTDYHVLASHVPEAAIDAETSEKLDAIAAVASRAEQRRQR